MTPIDMELFFQANLEDNFNITDKSGNPYFRYEYESKHKLSIQTWYGDQTDEMIIYIYKIAAKFGFEREHNIIVSISDLRYISGSFHLTNEWVSQKYIPKAITQGYKYTFLVKPIDLFAALATEDMLDILSGIEGLKEAKLFETRLDAYEYARQVLQENLIATL